MACLRGVDPEAPSHVDPDLFSHDPKRSHVAMVPAAKEIFEEKFCAEFLLWNQADLVAKSLAWQVPLTIYSRPSAHAPIAGQGGQ